MQDAVGRRFAIDYVKIAVYLCLFSCQEFSFSFVFR